MNDVHHGKKCSIVLCGAAGQGIQTVESLLTRVLNLSGFSVFSTKEYMSRIRGGMNSTEIRVSSMPVDCYVEKIDIAVPLDQGALEHLSSRLTDRTVILGEKRMIQDRLFELMPPTSNENERTGGSMDHARNPILDVSFSEMADEMGGNIFTNMIAAGVITGLLGGDENILTGLVKDRFARKGEDMVRKNIQAVSKGFEVGVSLLNHLPLPFDLTKNGSVSDNILTKGNEAVAMGAIAGGCTFISSYPMSPSTGVLTFLSQHARSFGIIAEQAEDEIAAINMVIGAWYAGARGMVTTSGGGFDLMAEGMSLAGMIESPVVVHLAQRPGPATGLPTRTEQGDLELALYSGHGDFPRILLAPGTLEEAFDLTRRAFDLADMLQIPVIILTDQYLMDMEHDIPTLDMSDNDIKRYVIRTDREYQRYAISESGISPRGIPGWGNGLVAVDSDEHDEGGHITEDLTIRNRMMEKRMRKMNTIIDNAIPPEFHGSDAYDVLLVGWGSTRNAILEAFHALDMDDMAFLHFKQVFPFPPTAHDILRKAKKVILIEGNATGQFGALITSTTGVHMSERILKYNGMPFGSDELTLKLRTLLDDGATGGRK